MTEKLGRSNQDRFRVFFEQNRDAMFVADPQTRKLIDCNLAAEKLTGRSRQEILKMRADDLHPQELAPATMEIFKRQVAGEDVTGESAVLSRNGQRIPVSINGAMIEIDGKSLAIGTFRDITEFKKNEAILLNSKTQFQELFNNISSGVAIYGAKDDGKDFIIIDINKSGERLSKVRREEIIGKSVLDVFPGVMAIGLFEIFQQVWKTGQPQHHPVSLYQDGRLTEWVKNYVFKLPLGQIAAVYEDFTEFKQIQESLKDAKEYLDNIINTIGDPVFVKDSQHRFVLINDAFRDLIGSPRQEIIGKIDYDFFPKEQVDVFLAKDEELLKSGQVNINEEEITDASGHQKVIVTKKTLYTDRLGNKFIVGVIRDITEHKNIEKALSKSEERFRSVALNAGEWIWETDTQGHYVYCSPSVENILGFKPEELLGKCFYDLFCPDCREEYKKSAFEVFSRKESFNNFFNRNTHKDGHEVMLETSGIPIIDNQGMFLGYRGVDRDITESKKMEDALRSSENLLSEMGSIAKIGGWEMDLATGKATWTKGTYDIVEIGYGQPIPGLHDHVDYYLPEYRQMIKEKMDDLIATKQGMSFEAQAKTAKGNIKWFRAIGEVVEEDGRVVKLRGILQDVTERKIAEAENIKHTRELEVFYKASINREERILELKKEVEVLKKQLGK
jgi:PAS domain S-box-containing protein